MGLAGVEGNGQTEFVGAIIGTEDAEAGSIRLLGKEIAHRTVRHRRNSGIGYVPQDRQQEGLLLFAPLWENAALGHQTRPPFANGRWFDRLPHVSEPKQSAAGSMYALPILKSPLTRCLAAINRS